MAVVEAMEVVVVVVLDISDQLSQNNILEVVEWKLAVE